MTDNIVDIGIERAIAIEKANKAKRDKLTKGPDGGDNGGMEARVARLESAVEHIQTDIRDMKTDFREFRKDQRLDFRLGIAFTFAMTLGLAGLIAKGFGWL